MKIFEKRKTTYTANFGGYDSSISNADKYFSEKNNPFDGSSQHLSNLLMAKFYKVINPFSYDIWVDANFEILNKRGFANLFSGDLCVFKHPFNVSIHEELNLCHKIGYVDTGQVKNIIQLYESEDLDMKKIPVYACGTIFRNEKGNEINNLWWKLICQYSFRDQLTFPYVVNRFKDLNFKVIDLDIYNNEYTKSYKHV